MTITIIAAIDLNGGLGRAGDMLYHIREDLRRFKRLTMGKPLVMGRKTFESLPGGALPGRRNIVVTRNPSYSAPGIETAPTLEAALEMASRNPNPALPFPPIPGLDVPPSFEAIPGLDDSNEVMVIGGGQIYAQAMPLAHKLEITQVIDRRDDADTFFPEIDPHIWVVDELSPQESDPRSGLNYRFITLRRKLSAAR